MCSIDKKFFLESIYGKSENDLIDVFKKCFSRALDKLHGFTYKEIELFKKYYSGVPYTYLVESYRMDYESVHSVVQTITDKFRGMEVIIG